jgi:molecular chaperone HscC
MILGIDLGTTHSLVGVYGENGPRLIANALGELLTPSVVSVDEDDTILVGRAARERLVTHHARTVAAFKRWMGSDRKTRLGRHSFSPEDLSALVLKSLVADAEAALGIKVDEAVISVPAYFSDSQRNATRVAGELAGLRVDRLINEPTAAALAYGLERREGGRFLVFDLGGGTFDVSILEMFDGVMEVHASAGDNFLGGEDFNTALRGAFLQATGLDERRIGPRDAALLASRLESGKTALSRYPSARIELAVEGTTHRWEIDEAAFAVACAPLLQRMRAPLERAMRDAQLSPRQLDEIILVGGASRMQLCAKLVSRMFGRLPLRHVNPDEAIAMGACVAAGLKARNAALEEVVLTDVCPYTLGVETSDEAETGLFSPIIQRNSTVPTSREETFFPRFDNQTRVELRVFQGESPRVANNILLGKLNIDLPPGARAENPIDVRFTYDINGLLQVEALARATGIRRELVVERNAGAMGAKEIAERLKALAALKVHPRDQAENVALLARGERLYEEHLWARDELQAGLVRFRSLLDRQDQREIERERGGFRDLLDRIEEAAP